MSEEKKLNRYNQRIASEGVCPKECSDEAKSIGACTCDHLKWDWRNSGLTTMVMVKCAEKKIRGDRKMTLENMKGFENLKRHARRNIS
jgi:hypothetical protein